MRQFDNFITAIENAKIMLKVYGDEVDTGSWQGVPTGGKPDLVKVEYLNWQASVPMGQNDIPWQLRDLHEQLQPNLPWADDHFEERVSRVPSNPGEQYKNWPWWHGQEESVGARIVEDMAVESATQVFKFTHTYQERFWPKRAGGGLKHSPERFHGEIEWSHSDHRGIRYNYGDLDDVVSLLLREPYTNQAYLPIFFPEDTGAVHGGRVPCTLGYHFILRKNKLHMWYEIRACDYVRHLRDDLYLACRLLLWMIEELQERELREGWGVEGPDQVWVDVDPGMMHFLAHSLHYHKGDAHHVS